MNLVLEVREASKKLLGLIGRELATIKLARLPVKDLTMISSSKYVYVKPFRDTWLVVRRDGFYAWALLGEELTLRFVSRYLMPGGLFVDVGAGCGAYTILALRAGMRVIAIEPDPVNFTLLKKNLLINNLFGNVRLVNAYAGSKSGMIRGVNVIALDDLLSEDPCIVKIDVDGAEKEVVQGALRTLKNSKIIVLELRPSTAYIANELLKIGKRVRLIEPLLSSSFIAKLIGRQVMPEDYNVVFIDESFNEQGE